MDMELYIPSKDVRKYLKEINHKFTDFETAAMISWTNQPWEVIKTELGKIRNSTVDTVLANQIKDYIQYTENDIAAFVTPSDKAFYSLSVEDEDFQYEKEGYFYTVKSANAVAILFNKPYRIKKYRIYHEKEEIKDKDDVDIYLGDADYDKDGNLINCSSCEVDHSTYLDCFGLWGKDHFNEAYVVIPHPFRRGDLVTELFTRDSNNAAIVPCFHSDEEWLSYVTRQKGYGDNSDVTIDIEFLCNDGRFEFELVNPIYLEYKKLEESDDRKKLIEYACSLLKGEGSIDYLQQLVEEYCEKKEKENEG